MVGWWKRRAPLRHRAPLQMTIATTDGRACGRSGTRARVSRGAVLQAPTYATVREMYPGRPRLQEVSDETRDHVSETACRPPRGLDEGAGI